MFTLVRDTMYSPTHTTSDGSGVILCLPLNANVAFLDL